MYRKPRNPANPALLGALLLLLPAAAAAQQAKPATAGPQLRAIAVLEFTAPDKARLVPVAVLEAGRYYEADIYRATPVPLALQADTVYEATRTGNAAGVFTITDPRRVDGQWFGEGAWEPQKAEAAPGAPELPPYIPGERDPGPPVLRRPPPPVEKEEQKESAPAPATRHDEDPDRPVLRRGRREPAKAASDDAKQDIPAKPPPAAAPVVVKERLVAVSDAQAAAGRPYGFDWSEKERARLTAAAARLAQAELARAAARRGVTLRGPLRDLQAEAFDLDYDNAAEVVFTASQAGATRSGGATNMHVMLLARVALQGEPQKLFASVTDDSRLDVTRRLELVDAVDADGDGPGELLFRAHGPGGYEFHIYRVERYVVKPVFQGAWRRTVT